MLFYLLIPFLLGMFAPQKQVEKSARDDLLEQEKREFPPPHRRTQPLPPPSEQGEPLPFPPPPLNHEDSLYRRNE